MIRSLQVLIIVFAIAFVRTSGSQPSLWTGVLLLRTSGTACPTGTTEATDLANRSLIAVTIASGEAGQTGGNDNITPTGTNSALIFTGATLGTHVHGVGSYDNAAVSAGTPAGTNSGTVIADHPSHTHTYTQVVNHTHTLATGTGATGNFSQVIGTVDTSSGGTGGSPTQTTLGTLSVATTGGVATGTTAGPSATLSHSVTTQPTFTGNALSTHDHTFSGSSEAISGGTPAGTINTPTFTGTQFDNRPAFIKVVVCRVN